MRKTVLTYGFIAGAIMSGLLLITLQFHDQIGFGKAGFIIGYASMALAFALVFLGVKAYRDTVAGGAVTFGRAFKVGAMIVAIASTCYVATWQFIYYRITPDFTEKYSAYALEQARKGGASEAEIAAKAAEMTRFSELYKNPLVNIGFTFLEPLPVGLVFTLVTAGVLSRKRRVAEPAVA